MDVTNGITKPHNGPQLLNTSAPNINEWRNYGSDQCYYKTTQMNNMMKHVCTIHKGVVDYGCDQWYYLKYFLYL